MTVIAYRDGIMAADGGTWQGDVLVETSKRKIFRLRDGRIGACCGQTPDIDAFVAWCNAGAPPDEMPPHAHLKEGEFGGIIVERGGGFGGVEPFNRIWKLDYSMRLYRATGEWAVEGAHCEFLMGGLAAGATAEQAVRLAIRHCAYAAGDVQVERL